MSPDVMLQCLVVAMTTRLLSDPVQAASRAENHIRTPGRNIENVGSAANPRMRHSGGNSQEETVTLSTSHQRHKDEDNSLTSRSRDVGKMSQSATAAELRSDDVKRPKLNLHPPLVKPDLGPSKVDQISSSQPSSTDTPPGSFRTRISDEERLLKDLFQSYNPSARPVIKSKKTVKVKMQFSLMHIQELVSTTKTLLMAAK